MNGMTEAEERVRQWVVEHRGILTRIAVQVHCSAQDVHAVAYGKSTRRKGNYIEQVLLAEGWPGCEL